MERRLLRILTVVCFLSAVLLLSLQIRIEPLPQGLVKLLKLREQDPTNTVLAQTTEECIQVWHNLREQRDAATEWSAVILIALSLATFAISMRLPHLHPKSETTK